jgi:plastocyanin
MTKTIAKVLVCVALVGALGWIAVARTHLFSRAAGGSHGMEIGIDNYSFMPGDITVKAGTTVIWVNHDDVPHTVRSTGDVFKSKALDTDDKFSFTFDKPGTYEYYCSVHPRMTAKVIVQ